MKKVLVIFMPLFLLFTTINVKAETTIDGFEYEVTESNTVEITGYTLQNENVSIPSIIDGKKVTAIDYSAFYGNKNIKSVTIPNTIEEIKYRAFYNCTNLKEVNLGNGVMEIGDSAFGYTSFSSIVLPDSLTVLGDSVFAGNHNLTTLNIPKNLKTIVGLMFDNPALKNIEIAAENNYYSFSNGVLFNKDKTKLVAYLPTNEETSYTIPSTVKELDDGAFCHNERLVTIVIPNSVETIGYRVFYNCTKLANINIPSSVTAISGSVFVNCNSLVDVTIDGNFGVLMFSFFENCENLESVTFTGEIFRTYLGAFKNCPKLKTIIFDGLYELREDTISNCPSLEKIQLSDVTQVIEKGFADDDSSSNLTINIPDGMIENATGYYKLYTVTLNGTYNYDQAKEVLDIVNQERVNTGLSELIMDEELTKAANERAKELALRFSHNRPDNSDGLDILSKVMGENIAAGQSTSTSVMDTWMNSPTHKSNILGSNYKSIGIGSYTNSGRTYWVQLFSNEEATKVSTLDGKEVKTEKGNLLATLFDFEIAGLNEDTVNNIKMGESLTPYRIQIYNMGVEGWATTVSFTDFTYESSNDKVATVNNGVITGISPGTATIKVSNGSYSKEYEVRVYNPVTDFTLKERVFLEVGNTTNIDVKYTPSNAEVISGNWYSYDKTIIDIDSKTGAITGKKVGTAYVTYTTEGITKGLTVTVVPKITNVSLNKNDITLKEGESFKLNATITPSSYYATVNDLVTWESSDNSIASVNNGEVKANNRGEVTITVTTIGGLKTTCHIKVLPANANSFVTKDDNNTYYYDENGNMVTGWKEIDGLMYYFNEDGVMLKGIHNVEGKNYFFGVTKGKVMYGFINYNGDTYYTDPETGELKTGVTIINNKPYFFGISKFKLQKGLIGYNEDYYYSNSEGILQTGMLEVNGNYYYFDEENGYKAVSGWKTIDNLKYYFDPVTKIRYQGIHNVEGKNYFFGITKGKVMYGFIGYEGDTYYSDPITGELKTGVTIVNNKPYFFGISKFKLQKGLIGYNGNYYYGNSEGILQTGMLEVNGNYYYFDEKNGYKAVSGWKIIDNLKYYFDPVTKIRYQGIHNVEGKNYFFGITKGKVMYGFIGYEGDTYYSDPITGELKTGVTIVNNKPYFFGISKFKLQKGLIGYNGNYYYGNSEGILQTGMLEVNGNYYYFDEKNGYKAVSGWKIIDNLKYYFDPVTKIRYQGIHNVEGKNYFFGITKGKVMLGFINYNGDTYYADPETGELATGVTMINETPYFFGITKFKLQKGLIGYNGDYYYSNSEGILQTGPITVNGIDYYFDETTYKAV